MDRAEEIFVDLFSHLREDLRGGRNIGLALKAQGSDITLRIRSEKLASDEKQPYFAVVVGESEGSFRVSYKPSGVPSAQSRVTIVAPGSTEELLGLVREYIEAERQRLTAYQHDQ
jgi:hypothetical protein